MVTAGEVADGGSTGPLDDLVVLDLTVARAGPTAVRQLADWGARVLRIEPSGPSAATLGGHNSSDYINLHRSKRLVQLDLSTDDGRTRLHELARDADVLVENFRAPVKHKLGIDYETLAAINPRLVYGSISGYGQDGPYADRGAVDQIIQGMGGLMSVTGQPGGGPMRAGIAVSDLAAGNQLAVGILIALHERERTGLGQWVCVSLLEAMISFLDFQAARWTVDGVVAASEGNHHPTVAPMGTFTAADGHLNVAALGERMWLRLCNVLSAATIGDATFGNATLGNATLAEDDRFATQRSRYQHRAELNAMLDTIFASRSRMHWMEVLNAAGVPCGPVLAMDEVFADPQVQHLDIVANVNHPVRGEVGIVRNSIRMSRSQPVVPTASPTPQG